MQLQNKACLTAAPASAVRAAVPVRVSRRGMVVKAAATAPAPVVADNAVVDKCVNSIRFLAIGELCRASSLLFSAPTPLFRNPTRADAAARARAGCTTA